MMKTFTRSDVLSWRPCHGEAKTLQIMEGLPEQMNALDVLRHEAAKPADRLWCVLRSEVLDDRTLRLFAAWCGRGALDAERTAGREPDPRSWAAVETAERYALGKATEDELRDARAAAYDAVCAAYDAACAAYAAEAAYAATGAYAYAGAYAARAAIRAVYAAVYAAARATDAASAARAVYAAVYAAAVYAAARATDARAAIRAVYAARAAQIARLIQMIEENEP